MKKIDWETVCLVLYVIGAVVCFGPAYVESEKDGKVIEAACYARTPNNYFGCDPTSLVEMKTMLKAVVWPMWLSYEVAK